MPARSSRFLVSIGFLVLPLVAAAGIAAAAPITFRLNPFYDAGGDWQQVLVAGDFDGDQQPDIALTHADGSVLWSLNSHGALAAFQSVTLPFPTHGLAAGDLNGDGRADLVGCDVAAANGALEILLSNGAGFGPAILVPTDSAGVATVTLADLDGDGDLDVVAANSKTNRVSRVFNDGTGHFSGLASTFVPGPVSRTWVADLNGDGVPDILTGVSFPYSTGSFTTRASWLLAGTGGGAFASPSATGLTGAIALGAFSGPGSRDAAVYPNGSGYGIAHGLGNGMFAAPVVTTTQTSGGSPWGTPIDLDGDGRDELLVATDSPTNPTNTVVFRVSAGLALVHRDVLKGFLGLVPAIADMDGDGHLDAVLAAAQVALNHDGHFDGLRTLRATAEWANDMVTQDLDVGDVNGDGAADVLVTDKWSAGYLFTSHHDRSFEYPVGWQVNSYIRQSALADLDGDGRLDALQVRSDPGAAYGLYSALGDGAGHFVSPTLVQNSPQGGPIAVDLDGDGDIDAITGFLYLNDGLGHLSLQPGTLPVTGTYGKVGGDPMAARFTTSGDNLSVEHQTSLGTLGAPVLTPVGATLTSARFADVNGDGLLDAVCLVNAAQVETFLGQAAGGWGPPVLSPDSPVAPGYTPRFVGIGDLDLDGRPDLIFTGAASYPLSILRNLGGGGFGERGDTPITWYGTVSAAADVDGDGMGDLVGLNQYLYGHFSQGDLIQSSIDVLFGSTPAPQPTPALVSLSSASAVFDRASLAWFVPSDGPGALTLERRRDGGAWSAIATVTPVGGRITYEDRAVDAGVTYAWRLTWEEDGTAQHSDLATLAIPQRPRFAIAGVRPNPADGDRVSVSLTLDRLTPVDLAVVDVAGRIVASRRVTPSSVGRVDVAFDGLSSLRPALYFVRAEQAGRRATTTLVRLH